MSEFEDVIDHDGKRCHCTYWSMDEWSEAAVRRRTHAITDAYSSRPHDWNGFASFEDAARLAKTGWQEATANAMRLASEAVEMAERTHEIIRPEMTYDVAGDSVDIGRYLTGEPECMIDYPLSPVSHEGKVITLVASLSCSSSIAASTVRRRGLVVCALALALSELGHSLELWVENHNGDSVPEAVQRIRVKAPDEVLDPAKIMFAYAHPAAQRQLAFAVAEGYPKRWQRKSSMGTPVDPDPKDYPEGTIILPSLASDHDVPDADQGMRKYLRQLGLLSESE